MERPSILGSPVSPETSLKVAQWIVSVNKELKEIDLEFGDISELLSSQTDTIERMSGIINTLLESLGHLYVRSQAQNARLTALETAVGGFLTDSTPKRSEDDFRTYEMDVDASEIDTPWVGEGEVQGEIEFEDEEIENPWVVDSVGIVVVDHTDAGFARAHIQSLFERG